MYSPTFLRLTFTMAAGSLNREVTGIQQATNTAYHFPTCMTLDKFLSLSELLFQTLKRGKCQPHPLRDICKDSWVTQGKAFSRTWGTSQVLVCFCGKLPVAEHPKWATAA